MTTLHQLRCFVASYEHGSLTAAARARGYSQPSVSEQVRLLERGMGAIGLVPDAVVQKWSTSRARPDRSISGAAAATSASCALRNSRR